MKKIKLTERDLSKLVSRVIKEQEEEALDMEQEEMYAKLGETIHFCKKLIDMGFDPEKLKSVLSASITRYANDNPQF
jgi:hypothetical protein